MWPEGGPGKRSDAALGRGTHTLCLVALLCLPGLCPKT